MVRLSIVRISRFLIVRRRQTSSEMKCLPVVILALVVIAAESKVLPASDVESQQTGAQTVDLSEYIKQAQAQLSNLGTQLQEKLQLPNQDEIFNTLKEQSSNLANNIQTYMKNVTEEVKAKTPELENLWSNLRTKLSEAITNLNVDSETTAQIDQLQAKFQEGVQTIMKESENAAKALSANSEKVQENITKLAKEAVDIAVQATKNLKDQLEQQATPAPQS